MGLSFQQGAGSGTVTYSIAGGASSTQPASATTTSYFNNDVLYSVILNMQFTDSEQGDVILLLTVDPFTGSGIYDSNASGQIVTLNFSTSAAGSGNWNNPDGGNSTVVLDTIYTPNGTVTRWQGSMQGLKLIWYGAGQQPAIDVHLSALTLTITQTSP